MEEENPCMICGAEYAQQRFLGMVGTNFLPPVHICGGCIQPIGTNPSLLLATAGAVMVLALRVKELESQR
jgi:hypothetical protein